MIRGIKRDSAFAQEAEGDGEGGGGGGGGVMGAVDFYS